MAEYHPNLPWHSSYATKSYGVRFVPALPALSETEGPVLSEIEEPVLSEVEGPVLSEVEGLSVAF